MARTSALCLVFVFVQACTCGEQLTRSSPEIQAEPAALDFGEVSVGASQERVVELSNQGGAPLTFSKLELEGAAADSFSIMDAPTPTLRPGNTVSVRVRFLPRRVGNHVAQFVVSSDAGNARALVIPLMGVGVDVAIAPQDAGDADAGVPDAGVPDAGVPDAGVPDAGVPDAGVPDAGVPDAGVPDAGVPDAGVPDAGVPDAGVPDAGGSCDVLPVGWANVVPWPNNPVLTPSKNDPAQGMDNVYGPSVQRVLGQYVMWYHAQGTDGHERVYMAWSSDRVEWRKWPTDAAPLPVLDRGTSNHAHDPSVVAEGPGVWAMYYAEASTAGDERIWLARTTAGSSNSLTAFTRVQEVLPRGPAGAWDSDTVGRPSVLLEGGIYKMWYDGAHGGQRSVGYATSTDGVNFVKHPSNPVVLDAGNVDVKVIGGVYVMVAEGPQGIDWYTSPDGVCWSPRGRLFSLSGLAFDAFGQVSPFLEVEAGVLQAVWFGGSSATGLKKNRIGVAFPLNVALPPGGGCTQCVGPGLSCPATCNAGGQSTGTCGSPGSTSAGACCACQEEGCSQCRGAHVDCNAACRNIGKAGGWCGNPGSTNPSVCCTCLE